MRALSSAAASPDLFLHDRTWEALRTIVLAEPSLPWMLISDSRDTAEQARRRLSQVTKGAARFIQPKCNGSSLASAAPMAAMTADVLLDFFALQRARGVVAIAPNSLHQGAHVTRQVSNLLLCATALRQRLCSS